MNKSFIGLIVVSTIFLIYATGFYTNFQTDSALEIVDFSIDQPESENQHSLQSRPNSSLW